VSNDNAFERVPDALVRKRRASAFLRVMGSLVGWGVFFILALGAGTFWGYGIFTAEGPLQQPKIVTLPEGASQFEIANVLQREGVITDSRVMNAASIINRFRGRSLKPGEYEFPSGAPMSGVLSAIAGGKVLTYKLTIPEGWTTQMALERVNANTVLTGDPIASVPEGALIADTQVFRRGMTRAKLVEDMKTAQAKLIDELWAKKPADSPLKSKEEMITLASIVEKETGKPEERARVASVFLNRLKQGMRLQSDPTIIYGIVGGAGKLERAITRADIDGQTPYNTYQIDGLPPGPIAIPGFASLEAVVTASPSKELFFVADGTGGHAFAETLEQHNENVKKWRESQKNGIQLPGEEAVATDPEPVVDVQQTPLPEVATAPAPPVEPAAPAAEPETEAPIAEAVKEAEKTQVVPEPAESAPQAVEAAPKPAETAPKVAEAAPKPAAPPPLPVEKKVKQQTASNETVAPVAETPPAVKVKLKPGTVVKVGSKMVPIPMLKRAKP
jgi:UPF0755 protein